MLQELNGRNVLNPLSCIHAERLYRPDGAFPGMNDPRHLRADRKIKLSSLNTGSRRLEQHGRRFEDWVEAKFFRGQTNHGRKHSTNKTAHTAGLMCDLIRLATLVSETAGTKSVKSRCLLYVYDSELKWHLPQNRSWLNRLTALGTHEIEIQDLGHEGKTVRKLIGSVAELSLNLGIHNLVILPVRCDEIPGAEVAGYERMDGCTGSTEEWTLEELIGSGETTTVEFKSCLRKNLHIGEADPRIEHSALKTIAGFLNASGGKLILAAADDGDTDTCSLAILLAHRARVSRRLLAI